MEYLSVSQAAERLKIKPDTVRRNIKRGLIKAERVGAFWLIHEDEVTRYEQERKEPGRPPNPA